MNHFDGCWIGPVIDQMTTLLVQFAEEADEANLSNPQAYQNNVLASEQSMQEDAIGKMTGMFRILRSENESPDNADNRSFGKSFLVLHQIKL